MGAPKGNQFWKFRTKHGNTKLFSDKYVFWNECVKYFEWCQDNPLEEEKVFHAQGEITRTTVSKMRAMTLKGLWFYLKISKDTWYNYKKDNDFIEVIREAEQVIYDQKFSGAAADLLNANIIARDLGLSDKQKLDINDMSNKTNDELDDRIRSLIKETNAE
jgi:hypothetical protein